jgi:hypothetical protein
MDQVQAPEVIIDSNLFYPGPPSLPLTECFHVFFERFRGLGEELG